MSKEATKAAENYATLIAASNIGTTGTEHINIANHFRNGYEAHESQQDKEMEEFDKWIRKEGYYLSDVPGRYLRYDAAGHTEYFRSKQLLRIFREGRG